MLDSGEDISIELATPDYNINVQGEEEETIQWDILDQLKTYNMGFRQNIDTLFNINIVTENGQNGKNGCMFVGEDGDRDGNTALRDSLRNKVYVEKYFSDKTITNKMADLAANIYADVESTSSIALYAAQIDEFARLYANNQRLRPQNYKGEITRTEAISIINSNIILRKSSKAFVNKIVIHNFILFG